MSIVVPFTESAHAAPRPHPASGPSRPSGETRERNGTVAPLPLRLSLRPGDGLLGLATAVTSRLEEQPMGPSFTDWSEVLERVEYAFQPIVNIHTGAVFGLEALLRNQASAGFDTAQCLFARAFLDGRLETVSLALLARAVRQRREDARLLFLTTDPAAAQEALRGSALPDALVRSAPPGEAARLLCAADYGLLLREDSPVNAVSCPVKFGEYLACGVRPILTPGIGDQSALCRESDLGVVVNAQNLTEAANRVLLDAGRPGAIDLAGRDRRRAWAAENISPARAASRLVEFLTAALGSA